MDSTFHLCAKVMLENLLENLFGKHYDMENKVLLFTQMSVLRQLRYLVIKVFNATFDSSVIPWWSVLLEGETGVPRENHRPAISHS
jgi:hypothetical protein